MAQKGSANRTIEWTRRNVGAGVKKVAKWDQAAGFGTDTAWCGIFLGAAMQAQGLPRPTDFAAAVNWSKYGNKVSSLSKARPGDILVYGTNHVAMYLGNNRQIQGNWGGQVAESTAGASAGVGPITAIRRPPYRGSSGSGGFSSFGPLGTAEEIIAAPIDAAAAPIENLIPKIPSPSEIANAVIDGILGDVAKSAEPLMLNIGLVGGGAFLVYYGAALMLGVKSPGAKLAAPITKGPMP